MYMLDTNTCIYVINKRPIEVLGRFERVSKGELCISVVTYAELLYGVARSERVAHNRHIVEQFAARLEVCPWDQTVAGAYGSIRCDLEKTGQPIGAMDLLIAAHALSRGCTLVTNNLKEFGRVPGLQTDNWMA